MGWQDTERGQTGMATVMHEVRVFRGRYGSGQCEDFFWNKKQEHREQDIGKGEEEMRRRPDEIIKWKP